MTILLASILATIVGTWERVAASPVSLMDSDPRGFSNHKVYYTPDGKVFILEPDEALSITSVAFRYRFDGKALTLVTPGGEEHTTSAAIKGDIMTVDTEGGGTFTYRRMSGHRPWDRQLEPRSLLILKSNDGQYAPEPRYDTRDYSKQPMAERVRGVWEVVGYSRVEPRELPPYGFPNDKYVFDGRRVSMMPPNVSNVDPDRSGVYQIRGNAIHVDDERWTLSFNRWGHMVLDQGEFVVTLKLISKKTATIPIIPVRIALLATSQ